MRNAVSRAPGAERVVTPLLTFGGPALFLLAQVFFYARGARRVPGSRPAGLVALAILGIATAPLTLIAGIAAATAVLGAVAVADTLQEDDQVPARPA